MKDQGHKEEKDKQLGVLINVPEIESHIEKRHKKFIADFGGTVDKVMADHKLMVDTIISRIQRVLLSFQKKEILDDIGIVEPTPQNPIRKIRLQKIGCNNYIDIVTNGKDVKMQGNGFLPEDFNSDNQYDKLVIRDVDSKKYNWTDFSLKLLDYIHSVIYERKNAVNTKLDSLWQPSPLNGEPVIRVYPSKTKRQK
jgi:hypothetical protein